MAYNGLVRLRERSDGAWADIDVQLKKRYDLIPNLVETVKGYASHEKDTLEAVINARKRAMSASGVGDQAQAENMLTQTLGRLFALAEAYPDLKANQNFSELQEELAAALKNCNQTLRDLARDDPRRAGMGTARRTESKPICLRFNAASAAP